MTRMTESKGRIQIVEDEQILAQDIAMQLGALGYEVVAVASSGESAIEEAETHHPDLVVMDLRLKGKLDGIDAAFAIHDRLNVPVVYLTAYSDEKILERAKITEPFGYVLKPFEQRELHAAIEMALYKHRMEMKLRENEAWFSTTLRSIGDGVIATDGDATITFMNPTAELILGWTVEEALGKQLVEVYSIVNEKTGRSLKTPANNVLKNGSVTCSPENSALIVKDGRRILIDDRLAPIKDEKGNVLGVVLVFQDITDRRDLEARMREMEKFQVFGQLASGVAHEVRNPLNAILAVTEALVQDLGEDPEYKPYLDHICTQVDRLSALMKDLLELGRPLQASSLQEESLPELLTAAVDLWKQTTTHESIRVNIIQHLDSDQVSVHANRAKLQQVFFNLLENAAQHSPVDSTIAIRIELLGDKKIRVLLIDQGSGISKDNLGKVFEPFFTTRRGGIGFGLSLVKRIIELHSGRVSITNNDPQPGCTIEVVLPRMERK